MSASTTTTTSAGNADRYGGVIATKLDTAFDPKQVPDLVKSLRASFNTDKTLSKAWRVSQLNAMLKMIEEGRKELRRGMKEDLHKSDIEGDLTELDLVISEIHHALESLDEWMAPESTNSSALNVPCSSEIKPDPLGLILIMGAWNYPMQLTLAPMVGAIAAGNCIVIKPGSYAVSSSHILVSLISKYMDQSCIRCIEGNREVTEALLKEKFDKICFTGSTYVGKLIAMEAAKTLTPVLLELGGKSPTIVDKTADLDHAVKRIIWGSFMNSGQTCVRPDFGLIHEDVADEFFKRANAAVKQFYGSDPQKTEFFGRIINDTACKRLSKLQEECKNKIVVGNGRNDLSDKFIEPTVFDFGSDLDAFSKSPLMQDEIFGPLYPCARFREVDQAIQFIRNLPTGKPLALYCFSKDSNFIKQITERTSSGGLCINDCLMHLANHELPFGGVGNSGMGGGYHGKRSFIQFSHEKAVLTKYQTIDQLPFVKPLLELRFPPYDTPLKKVILPIFGNHHVGRLVTLDYPWLRKAIVAYLAYLVLRTVGFKIVRE